VFDFTILNGEDDSSTFYTGHGDVWVKLRFFFVGKIRDFTVFIERFALFICGILNIDFRPFILFIFKILVLMQFLLHFLSFFANLLKSILPPLINQTFRVNLPIIFFSFFRLRIRHNIKSFWQRGGIPSIEPVHEINIFEIYFHWDRVGFNYNISEPVRT
jgi:hypothetical protein